MLFLRIIIAATAIATGILAQAATLKGHITDASGNPVDFATLSIKELSISANTDNQGAYSFEIPEGSYTLHIHASGMQTVEKTIELQRPTTILDIQMDEIIGLNEIVVTGRNSNKARNTAYNSVDISTRSMENSSGALSEVLSKAPGIKLRESGGVGSDMAISVDGFSGKHVKIFIDGIPQEGSGASLGINNMPINFAERIEVYRGVVPVGFGTDAIGGVINIVTSRKKRPWFANASYSFGSFNTHRSNINIGKTFSNGIQLELTAFQNFSDNDYTVQSPIEDFATGAINRRDIKRVRRFNDNYHNEAVEARIGIFGKRWADRLSGRITYSHMYKEIQTGVRQEIVYGAKHRHGQAINSTIEYSKRDIFTQGLDIMANGAYTMNTTVNVDTSSVKYNWLGQTATLNSPGEQSYMNSEAINHNWTAGITAVYRIGQLHEISVNNVFNAFRRTNTNLLTVPHSRDDIPKSTYKNILGAAYRLIPSRNLDITVFGKIYTQHLSGPIAASSAQDTYVRTSRRNSYFGFGTAAALSLPLGFRLKASYEKAYRLPTIEEMFGDEDLEVGEISLRPESSHNLNLGLSYEASFAQSSFYGELSMIMRHTGDYIQRNILSLGGGKSAATYINYGKVSTAGISLSARYTLSKWFGAGTNISIMDIRDNMPFLADNAKPNPAYRQRMPNLPYMFADTDINFYWHGLGARHNVLTLTYDNRFTRKFCYYTSNIGANSDDYMVPDQLCHNISLTYSIKDGRYNLSFECRNIGNAALYDNFSLQKAGRAFYGKIRVCFN